jgi:hypothetical protein
MRHILFIAFLTLAMIFPGCRKEEETGELSEAEQQERQIESPNGYTAIPDTSPTLFITNKPVQIGDYVEYLEKMGQDVPPQLRDADPSEPVRGLSQAEAEKLAIYCLSRLPTEDEWQKAKRMVGDNPYPWPSESTDDGSVVFLVRDWREGDPGQRNAEKAREELLKSRLAELKTNIAEIKQKLVNATENAVATINQRWTEIKPELFAAIEGAKKAVQANAKAEKAESALEILERIHQQKVKVVALQIDEATDEKLAAAGENYRTFLSERRNEIQKVKSDIMDRNRELSERLRESKKNIEDTVNSLHNSLGVYLNKADELEVEDVDGMKDAVALYGEIKALLAQLNSEKEQAIQILDQLNAKAQELSGLSEADVKQDTTKLEAISEIKQKIMALNKHLDMKIDHESQLFTELDELLEQSARMQGMEEEIRILTTLHEQIGDETNSTDGPSAE